MYLTSRDCDLRDLRNRFAVGSERHRAFDAGFRAAAIWDLVQVNEEADLAEYSDYWRDALANRKVLADLWRGKNAVTGKRCAAQTPADAWHSKIRNAVDVAWRKFLEDPYFERMSVAQAQVAKAAWFDFPTGLLRIEDRKEAAHSALAAMARKEAA